MNFCDALRTSKIDYPQVFSAELIKMDNINLKKILSFNNNLMLFRESIGGFHTWGKRKSEKGRWAPHTGNLDTFFSNHEKLKQEFLESILQTFNDDIERCFVPEVNSGESDLLSIVSDMEQAGFAFISEKKFNYQLIRIKWVEEQPLFELYNRYNEEVLYKKALGNISLHITSSQICLGSHELGTHKHIPCKSKNIVQEKKYAMNVKIRMGLSIAYLVMVKNA